MRNSHPERHKWAQITGKCLNIGSYCTLCARYGAPQIDLCVACASLFRACQYFTDRNAMSTSLCLGCGEERTTGWPQRQSPHCLTQPLGMSDVSELSQVNALEQSDYCKSCSDRAAPVFKRIVAPYRYAHPVDQLLKRLKYTEDRQLARVFGTLLGNAVKRHCDTPLPQWLLPMPLHASRLRQRGFNQAQDIAHWAGRCLGLTVAAAQVSRVIDTGSLAGLNRLERQYRILGAFRAGSGLNGKHVAIVDDVLTTGASARELARELYDSGAESVELWVLARTSSLREGA